MAKLSDFVAALRRRRIAEAGVSLDDLRADAAVFDDQPPRPIQPLKLRFANLQPA